MNKKLLLLFTLAIANSLCFGQQNFQNYFKEGMYHFDDTRKILKSEIFTTYLPYFNFSSNNIMSLQKEMALDSIGTVSGSYQQYCNGYPVETCQMNVISKYGVVFYVNGFSLPQLNVNVNSRISDSSALDSALQFIGAPKYTFQDATLEQDVKISFDAQTADTVYDSTKTLYPKGSLVIALPYGDTSYSDTGKYALCYKFFVTPMHWDTVVIDTNTVDTIPHYDTVAKYIQDNTVIIYVNARTGRVYTSNPNIYAAFWDVCHLEPTKYHGNQDVQIRRVTFGVNRWFTDSREVSVRTQSHPTEVTHGSGSHWTNATTDLSAYWCFEKSWDYFYNMGYNGPNWSRNPQKILSEWSGFVGEGDVQMRVNFNPTADDIDEYHINDDFSSFAGHESAAYLDVIGHEYTHAMIYHKPGGSGFISTGEPGSIAEGFCDYFGTKIGRWAYPDLYNDDWTDGFAKNNGVFPARHFNNPPLDASLDTYHYPLIDNKYLSSGIFRKAMWLIEEGGVHNSVIVPARPASISGEPNAEWDVRNALHGWCWSGTNYANIRDAFVNEYAYFHGECSAAWKSAVLAWRAVGIGSPPACVGTYIVQGPPKVIRVMSAGNNSAILRPIETRHTVHIGPAGGNEEIQAASYTWKIPVSVFASYPDQNDMSTIKIDSISDIASQYISCIVTYTDTTIHPDTITTVVHFVGDDYETIANKGSIKGGVFSNTDQGHSDDFKVYPNPVKSQLNIELPENVPFPLNAQIFDVTGHPVIAVQKLYRQNSIIALSDIPGGVYILKVSGEGKEYIRRIIVE